MMPKLTIHRLLGSRLVRAGLGSSGLRIATVGITLASSIVLARLLGPEALGVYAFALAIVSIAGLPVQLGIPTLVLRETAKSGAQSDWGRMRGIWVWAGRRIALATAVILPVLALGAWVTHGSIVPQGGLVTLWISLALIPLIAAAQLRGAALRGLHHVVLGQLPEAVIRPGGLLIILALSSLLGATVGSQYAMASHVVASLIAFGIGAALVAKLAPKDLIGVPADQTDAPDWAKAVWPLAMIAGMQILMQNFSVFFLGVWSSTQDVGLFRIATAAANMTLIGLTIANLVVAPRFAKLHAEMGTEEMARTARITAGVSFVAALPIALILILAGPQVLGLLYGAEFIAAAVPMAILALAQLVNAYFGSCVSLLNMSGHERVTARALMISAITNIALNVVLVPLYGGLGAALAMLVSTTLWNVFLNAAVSRHLGFSSSAMAAFRSPGGP